MADCLFCKIANHQIQASIVYEDDALVAFNDINPQAPTHILLIPTTHYENAAELAGDDPSGLAALVTTARTLAQAEGIDRSGYRVVTNTGPDAGQSVFHLHLHLLAGRGLSWPPG